MSRQQTYQPFKYEIRRNLLKTLFEGRNEGLNGECTFMKNILESLILQKKKTQLRLRRTTVRDFNSNTLSVITATVAYKESASSNTGIL